jgi:hypothetical protein
MPLKVSKHYDFRKAHFLSFIVIPYVRACGALFFDCLIAAVEHAAQSSEAGFNAHQQRAYHR